MARHGLLSQGVQMGEVGGVVCLALGGGGAYCGEELADVELWGGRGEGGGEGEEGGGGERRR